jgi:hypothetical protein
MRVTIFCNPPLDTPTCYRRNLESERASKLARVQLEGERARSYRTSYAHTRGVDRLEKLI